ncbi:helix-turn-helix domain-containing protein [Streptococcus anginosus]|uniref:Peptidase S24-like protein n=2 Tax=Streptococcus TaxID=1301 RepID=I0S8Z1_STRAP|nr:XRE family transcriptional regulator [Streptococcus anginosus]EID19844.1 peptidase S24-like protein [Streptococcus anginosus subsp. whileyi CCUG 39159]KXT69358.1 Phage CI-like repressor [Streptococcus gordonii]QQT08974.1 helix-turn-helix transcriptional regulator [Streptococcus anginosus]
MIGSKIRELRKKNNLTLDELEKRLNAKYPNTVNFNKGKLSKWENNKDEPRLGSVAILADFFGVSVDYFMDKQISNDKSKIQVIYDQLVPTRQENVMNYAENQLHEQENNIISISDDRNRIIAHVEGVVAAGLGSYQEENLHMEVNLIEDEVPDKYDTIAQVVGDSMEPLIRNDDLLFIEVTSQVEINSIGIFQINGKNFVKKLKRDYDGRWYLQSLNNNYEEIHLSENDDIRTIGEVVGVYREN